ncbi:hypothetical protein BS50DRAFT_568567 [Corynespora cassiicola Philippines]|uniref:Uncharacterized protein n=1 Tax=Corynespora cassiicola Philippines TaxID=1448308 RepID=A0A2T2P5L6_CORCC|nr:hypothetical protein BS50DRAFT_568567 [Corynespora cassiicola Philippines]
MKQKRNEQWDDAFAALRKDTEEWPAPQRKRRNPSMAEPQENYMHTTPVEELLASAAEWDCINRAVGAEMMDDHIFQERQALIEVDYMTERLWSLIKYDSRFPGTQALDWPVNTGPALTRHHLPPQSLWSLDPARMKSMRRRHTWKKLAIQELSIGALIQALLMDSKVDEIQPTDLAGLSAQLQDAIDQIIKERSDRPESFDGSRKFHSTQRQEFLENMKILEHLPSQMPYEQIEDWRARVALPCMPQYSQDPDGDFYEICRQMNAAIKKLFDKPKNKDGHEELSPLAVARICHNLLVSTSAPDVQTFNILMIGLKRWKRIALVDDVIAALDACKIRPNEITCTTILDFYTQTDRPDHFSRFVGRMRGVGNALMLAHPDTTINEMGQSRLVRVNDVKIHQKIYPTPVVFNTLMQGVLKFAGLERALEIYYEMKEDGWGLDMPGLNKFLDECVRSANWYGGLYVWNEIESIKHKVRRPQMAHAYSQMLALCTLTGNTVVFNQVLRDVVQMGHNRKSIMEGFQETVHLVQHENGIAAPAWAADNVLIAMSDYMPDDAKPDGAVNSNEPKPETKSAKTQPESSSFAHRVQTPQTQTPATDDPEALWAAWIAHEFGEVARPEIRRKSTSPEEDEQHRSGVSSRKP